MPIGTAQKIARQKHLGSSDMSAILGLDPRRNAYDVYLEKTGKLMPEPENQAMYAGTMFEDGILSHAESSLGKLIRNQYRSAKDKGLPLGANIDALLVKTGDPIEVKTAGLYGPLTEHWGDAGTDQVPDRVLIQTHVHMICTDKELCHVAAFLGGRGFQLFVVPRDQQVSDIISTEADSFWRNNVERDVPPTDLLPHAGVIKRVRRQPETIVQLDQSLIDYWLATKECLKEAKNADEQALTAILTALGDAEAGQCETGLFTYLEQTRAEYTVKASTYRVSRFKKNK